MSNKKYIMENSNDNEVNPQTEQELLKTPVIDEVRKAIIAELELDEELDTALIDKAVERELKSRKALNTAIKQKIEWREKATSQTGQNQEVTPQVSTNPSVKTTDNFDELLEKKVTEKLEEKELNSLDYSDELKSEVKNYAKANGMSIAQAIKSPYMEFLRQEEAKKDRAEDASLGNKRRPTSSQDISKMKPTDFDMSTEEGRKGFAEYKKVVQK